MSKRGIRVAVYGTLKAGKSNSDALRTAELLGTCAVAGNFKMFDLGHYPCVVRDGEQHDKRIYVEVYSVDEATLNVLDMIEGHPDYYEREKVGTPWKNAWMYFLPNSYARANYEPVETGCWKPDEAEQAYFYENEGKVSGSIS